MAEIKDIFGKHNMSAVALAMKAGAKAIRSDEDFMMADYVYDIGGDIRAISFREALQILCEVSDAILEGEEKTDETD